MTCKLFLRRSCHATLINFLIGLCAAVHAVPPAPAFTSEINTQPNNYVIQGVIQPESPHYFHPFQLLGAALALDNQATPTNGRPPGYHTGYANTGFIAPLFSADRLTQFYDCNIENNPDDFGCNYGLAQLSRILMPTTIFDNKSPSCVRSILGHELFHHIQYAYADQGGNSGCSSVFGGAACEGHARAMQDKIYSDLDLNPEAECTAPFLGQVNNYLKNAHRPLWESKYDSALWWSWLMEQYGSTHSEPQRGTDFLARWYIEAAATMENPNPFLITDAVIKHQTPSDSVVNAFHDFTIANVVKDLSLSNVSAAFRHRYSYRDEDPVPGQNNAQVYGEIVSSELLVPNAGMREMNYSAQLFGASYARWDVSNCPVGSTLRYEGDPTMAFAPGGSGIVANPSTMFSLVAVRGGIPQLLYKNRSTGWTQEMVQPLARYDQLITVVSGLYGDVQGVQRVTCDTVAHVPSMPFTAPSNPVTPGHGDSPWSFELALIVPPVVPQRDGNLQALGDGLVQVFAGSAQAKVLSPVRQSMLAGSGYQLRVHAEAFSPALADGDYDLSVRVGDIVRNIPQGLRVGTQQAQVLLALDTSSSMLLPSAGSRLNAVRRAARQLVFALSDDARLGLIEFAGNNIEPDNDATLQVPLLPLAPSHRNRLRAQIDVLNSGQNQFTSIGDAMSLALQEFTANAAPRQRRHLVLLCDGSENENARWRDVDQDIIGAGIAVHTIALGPLADQPLLQQIASATGGSFYYVPVGDRADEATLGDVFSSIVEHIEQRTRIAQRQNLVLPANHTETLLLRVPTGLNLHERHRFVAQIDRTDAGPVNLAQVRVLNPSGIDLLDGVNGVSVRRIGDDVWVEGPLQVGQYSVQINTGIGAPGSPAISVQVFAGISAQAGLSITTGMARPLGDPASSTDVLLGEPVQVQVGLLLPAVQKIREAAAKMEHPNGSSDLVALNDSGERGDANAGDGIWSGLYRRTTQGAPTGFPDDATQAGVRGSVRASLEATIVQDSALSGTAPVLTQAFASLHFPIRNASTDSDGDLMPSQFELRQSCLNPAQPDGSFDADSDERVNLLEFQDGTDPCNSDTDGGGETDGSERARAASGLDPSDDALPPMGFAQMEAADSEHEGTSVLPPNSVPIRYAAHRSYASIRLERATSSTGPWIVIESFNPHVSPGLYVDTQLVPGRRYWYRMHPRTAAGEQGASGPIFSAIARADAHATMGTMSLHFGKPRTDDLTLNVRQAVYQKRWSTSNYQMRIGDLPAGDWLSFVPNVNFAAPKVAVPTLLDVAVRFRDSEGQESIDYIDSIMLYPPGSLASVRLRLLSSNSPSFALRGVLVRVVDSEIEPVALSDRQGNAALEDLLPGSYRLEINAPGQPSQFRQVLLSAGQVLNLGDISVGSQPDVMFANGFE
jgi:Mg-chelatase subunit ChlD